MRCCLCSSAFVCGGVGEVEIVCDRNRDGLSRGVAVIVSLNVYGRRRGLRLLPFCCWGCCV